MSGPKVAVVGGSIAGLTAANVLRDASCEVDVYERSETLLSGFGTGIVVQPELVRYLLERTSTTLDDISVPSHEMRYFDAASGRNAGQVDAGWRFTAYNAVYQKLLDAFGTERYHLGKELVRVTPGVEGASASFADGTEVTADLVVCADGGGSVARAQLLGRKPDYAGYVTWRGMVDQRDVSPETTSATSRRRRGTSSRMPSPTDCFPTDTSSPIPSVRFHRRRGHGRNATQLPVVLERRCWSSSRRAHDGERRESTTCLRTLRGVAGVEFGTVPQQSDQRVGARLP